MARREFPALGFDPAPGDPDAIAAAAARLMAGADLLGTQAAELTAADPAGWRGPAAEEFRTRLGPLPEHLTTAFETHRAVSAALAAYHPALRLKQRQAAELETQAQDLIGRIRSTDTVAVARQLVDQLAEVRRRARDLKADRSAAERAINVITGTAKPPYREPSGWQRFKSWIRENAGFFRAVSTVYKSVSAVLGVLSMIPGLQMLAPIALAVGLAAVIIDGVLASAGEGSWKAVALDAALTVLPTGPVVKAVRMLPGVATALDAAGNLVGTLRAGRLARLPATGSSELATPVPFGKMPAVHDDASVIDRFSTPELRDLWNRDYADISLINRSQFLSHYLSPVRPPAGEPSFLTNCGDAVEAVEDLMNGTLRQAVPQALAGDSMTDIAGHLGVSMANHTYTQYWNGVVLKMLESGEGARGIVQIHRHNGTGHMLHVVHDHNGVVFRDPQVGQFGKLERSFKKLGFLLTKEGNGAA